MDNTTTRGLMVGALIVLFAANLFAADAPEDFRLVDGRLYNIQKSTNWLRLSGSPVAVTNGALLFRNPRAPKSRPVEMEKVITQERGQVVVRERIAASDAYLIMNPPKLTPMQRGERNSWQLPEFILVRNLHTNYIGQQTTFVAMRAGSTNGFEIWDVGTAPTNQTTAATR